MGGMMKAAAAFGAWVESGINDAMNAFAATQIGRKMGLDANASSPTERTLYNRNMKVMQGMADAIKDGASTVADKTGGIMDSFRATDFGKAAALGKAKEQTKAIIATGARATGEWMGPMLPPKPKVDPFSKFTTMGFGAGGLSTGGLGGQSGLGGAYNQIRRGDSAKRAAEARKIKDPVEESNALLSDLLNVTKTAWGN
jgi:hypothetical protein